MVNKQLEFNIRQIIEHFVLSANYKMLRHHFDILSLVPMPDANFDWDSMQVANFVGDTIRGRSNFLRFVEQGCVDVLWLSPTLPYFVLDVGLIHQ
jgi:hypothetical protein